MAGQKKEVRPGVWKLRVSLGKDPVTGKYLYVSKTFEGGPPIADKALASLAASSREVQSAVTVDGLLEEFLVACRAKRLESSTIQFCEGAAKHASSSFGKTRIEALSARDLEMLYRSMAQKGLSSARVRRVHSLMHRSLDQAVKWGWLEKNVAKLASVPTVRRKAASAPTPEELGQLLEAYRSADSSRFIAQSVAWQLPDDGGEAIIDLENAVALAGGVVIRYGQFYGPGTYYVSELPGHPRISINQAAQRSLVALTMQSGILTLCEA